MRALLAVAAGVLAVAGFAEPVRTEAARVATPAPSRAAASERQVRAVVRAWSNRLNAGNNAGVARLFSLPAIMVQGSYTYRFTNRAQLADWHSRLPCSGRIVSIEVRGQIAIAVFRLADRGSTRCDAPGTLVAARFELVEGKIALWVQIPVPEKPDDPGPVA
jgi:hypothetical protein